MPRLIDAEKADRRIEQFLCGGCDDYHNCGNCLAHKALSFLRGEPTVDAEPVRHGRWQRERNPMRYQVVPYVFVCDQCGTAFEYDTPYCGECGAKMQE